MKNGKLKILLVIDHLDPGGAQVHLVDFVRHLDRNKFEPIVFSLRDSSRFADEIRALGMPLYFGGHKFNPWKVARLARLIRMEQVDIVHLHLQASRIIGIIAARLAGMHKIVVHGHSGDELLYKCPVIARLLIRPLERYLLRSAARLIPVSRATAQFETNFFGVPEEKIQVIYNWVDVVHFDLSPDERRTARKVHSLSESTFVIGTVGRLSALKGLEYLLRAIPSLLAEYPDVRYFIVGDGEQRAALLTLCDELGISEQVRFLGYCSDVRMALALFDLFVMPSVYETLGIAAIEALAAGVPVVASRVGGLPEIVENEKNGSLVPPGDTSALATAILGLIGRPEKLKAMAHCARQSVQSKFDRSSAIRQIEAIYNDL